MNGAIGVRITEDLAVNLDQNGCVAALQKAALDAGLQIQGLLRDKNLRDQQLIQRERCFCFGQPVLEENDEQQDDPP